MNPSTTTSSSLTAPHAPPPASSTPPTFATLPGEIRNRIFTHLYEEPRRGASCAVNRKIYDEARAVLVRTHPFVKVTGIVSTQYNNWIVAAPIRRLLTVQFGAQGKVTDFKHYHMNIRVKNDRQRSADQIPRVHIMLVGDEEIRTFCRASTVGEKQCREYVYRIWFHRILPASHRLRLMEARILHPFVAEWSEVENVEIGNIINHDLALDAIWSVRGCKNTTSDTWLQKVADSRLRVMWKILSNDILGAWIAYDEHWIILVGTKRTQQWISWAVSNPAVTNTTMTELGVTRRLEKMIDRM